MTPQSENRSPTARRTPRGFDFQLGGEGRIMSLAGAVDNKGGNERQPVKVKTGADRRRMFGCSGQGVGHRPSPLSTPRGRFHLLSTFFKRACAWAGTRSRGETAGEGEDCSRIGAGVRSCDRTSARDPHVLHLHGGFCVFDRRPACPAAMMPSAPALLRRGPRTAEPRGSRGKSFPLAGCRGSAPARIRGYDPSRWSSGTCTCRRGGRTGSIR